MSLIDDIALRTRIVEMVKRGVPIAVACRENKISRQTIYNWRKRAARGEAQYAEFIEELDAASATTESRLHMLIERAAAEDWRAAKEKLKLLFPTRYAEHLVQRQGAVSDFEEMLDSLQGLMRPESFENMIDAFCALQGIPTEEATSGGDDGRGE